MVKKNVSFYEKGLFLLPFGVKIPERANGPSSYAGELPTI